MPYRGSWRVGTTYAVGDTIDHRFESFTALTAHTSAAASEPDFGASWATDWNRTSAVDARFTGTFGTFATPPTAAPTGATESIDRLSSTLTNNVGTLTTGKMVLQAIPLVAGQVVTNITFRSGTVAAVTPTNWGYALYTEARVKMAQTADQTTTAFPANTHLTKALQTPQAISVSGVYYVGCWMAAATVISHLGTSSDATLLAIPPIVFGATSDTGLTTTAPANAGAITAVGGCIYVYVT